MKKMFAMFAAVVLGVLGLAAPARAAASDCLSTYVCLFGDAYYGGSLYQWQVGYINTLPGDCLVLSGGANNTASSIINNAGLVSGHSLVFFDLNGGGANFGRTTTFSDSNLADGIGVPAGFNNKISTICVR